MEGANDARRFIALMAKLGIAYGETVTDNRTGIYAEAMSDLDLDALEDAADQAIRECPFFPRVAELRAFAKPKHELRPGWEAERLFPRAEPRPVEREPEAIATVLADYGRLIEDGARHAAPGPACARTSTRPQPEAVQTPEEVEARKQRLRDQLAALKRDGRDT